VKPVPHLTPAAAETTVSCAVAAFGAMRVPGDALPTLRQTLRLPGGQALPTAFLKHCDEQTVVGLAAVFQAITDFGLAETSFTPWGVLAAPRYLGRACLAQALHRFQLEGAWGVSPHLIPHRSLHSPSGTISQALGIHGPNFGVGGGVQAAGECIVAAAAMLCDGQAPGVWVVLTGLDPEPILDPPSGPLPLMGPRQADVVYGAAALALTTCPPAWSGPCLHIYSEQGKAVANGQALNGVPWNGRTGSVRLLHLEAFVEFLTRGRPPSIAWRFDCAGGMTFERGAETSL
jgi:hypothetical protein